jgi:hypothetical protein
LVLTDKETKKADEVMVEAGLSDKKFVCVEPNSKKVLRPIASGHGIIGKV